ncbi:hypothetical protein BJF79_23790 [Actinomadura sp. CNU-125]|uniref:hypothetical protein n=1 Tax=Actinomadura sp. CNU-125 TaxID=1904961 RepID=UPI00095F5A87|nr:hypothetical protein [Actinomadura sp. CNU-125]OLT11587.1 hypothetical protein BJF79_23790 [Actinomadura sp. CNU-125]
MRFSELIEELYCAAHVRAFVQVGPGGLTGFVGDRLGDREHLAIAATVPERDATAQLRRGRAALWAEGYGASPAAPPRSGMPLDLGTPLVRLAGAVPPVRLAPSIPPLPDDDPIIAELEALLNDAAAGAQSVADALGTGPSHTPDHHDPDTGPPDGKPRPPEQGTDGDAPDDTERAPARGPDADPSDGAAPHVRARHGRQRAGRCGPRVRAWCGR